LAWLGLDVYSLALALNQSGFSFSFEQCQAGLGFTLNMMTSNTSLIYSTVTLLIIFRRL